MFAFCVLIFLSCSKKSPLTPAAAAPTPSATAMPSVYVLDDMESGVNDWVFITDSIGNLNAEPAIISSGYTGSYALSITLTAKAQGTAEPYTATAYSLKVLPFTNLAQCSGGMEALNGGPNLTGYTTMKFDAKINVVTPPASGTLSYGIRIRPNLPCGADWDKYATASYVPGISWSQISIPVSTLSASGLYTLPQVLADVNRVEFEMTITSSQADDTAVTVLYLDNIRFE